VITTLPPRENNQNPVEYLEFCSAVTEGIQRLLLVENPGKEVITQFS